MTENLGKLFEKLYRYERIFSNTTASYWREHSRKSSKTCERNYT